MTVKNSVGNFKKDDNGFVLIRMDTLTERLRRMRALNATASNIGITQYTWRSCAVTEVSKNNGYKPFDGRGVSIKYRNFSNKRGGLR